MQSIGKLNFDDGIRTIEVNDKGEYISLSINDNTLVERFAELLHWFEESQARVHTYAEKFEKKYGYVTREDDNGDTEVNTEAVLELCSFQSEISRQACEKIDNIFGPESCKKVFGDIVPNMRAIGEFLEQLAPFLEKIGQERMNRYERRYNANRKGSRNGKHQRNKKELIKDYGQKQLQHSNGPAATGVERNTH